MRFIFLLDWIQNILDFQNWNNPQFSSIRGVGRIALISFVLSCIITTHFILLLYLLAQKSGFVSVSVASLPLLDHIVGLIETRINLLVQWIVFVIIIALFHLLEFFVTASYNPTVADASSFVVNHSKAYTSAMLVRFSMSKCFQFLLLYFLLTLNRRNIPF